MQSDNGIYIALDEKFYQSAYRQIVTLGKVKFPEHDEARFTHLIRSLPSEGETHTAKALYRLMGEKTFEWALHEKCLALCKAHNIYPCWYRFYTRELQYPTTVLEGLDYLTVAEMKPLLKVKRLPVSGKRDVLINRLEGKVSFDELEDVFLPKFKEKLEDYAKKFVLHQYELLVNMITYRAHFLERMQQVNLVASRFDRRRVEIMNLDEEEKKLAKLIDGKGYDGIIENNQIVGFLPIFPSGTSKITAARVTS